MLMSSNVMLYLKSFMKLKLMFIFFFHISCAAECEVEEGNKRWPGNININNSLELREESHTCQTNTYYSTHCVRCRTSAWRVPNARWQYPNHIESLSNSWPTIMYKESMLGWINEYNNRLVSIDWMSTNYYRSKWLLFGSIMTDSNHEW